MTQKFLTTKTEVTTLQFYGKIGKYMTLNTQVVFELLFYYLNKHEFQLICSEEHTSHFSNLVTTVSQKGSKHNRSAEVDHHGS